jgi:hypothetical protein
MFDGAKVRKVFQFGRQSIRIGSQLVVKIQAVALPKHVRGIGTISSQSFFVYLALPKLLMLGKTQICLVFRSLNRNFAP